jgi:cellulose synthase/poly-beta-1,6-N-acetylglucosamine synthase-like glycosyltransferase
VTILRWLGDLLAFLSIGAVVNSVVRMLLMRASAPGLPQVTGPDMSRWLVVIPAREEGTLIEPTVRSIREATGTREVRVIVLLDGADPVAEQITQSLGFEVAIKEPAGPTKAKALAWLATQRRDLLDHTDVVLLLDVGSTVTSDFFTQFRWLEGSAAVQCFLHGRGIGAGKAAAASEDFAQRREDVGRQRLGWNVQLRGTGTAFRPEVFMSVMPRLSTQIEDFESSLLLTADGSRLTMAPPGAAVIDQKPHAARDATVQRSRWLAGQIQMLLRHGGSFGRVIRRRPAEGIALLSEMFARPLSLTVPLRFMAAALLFWVGTPVRLVVGATLVGTAIADVVLMRTAAQFSWRESLTLGGAWVRALGGVPRAFFRWRRARKL